jgi:hypothetical protein
MENPEFIKRSFNVTVGKALLLNPATLPELGVAVQVNNVPVTFEVRVIFVVKLLQICLFKGVFEISGKGYMVTMKL